MYSKRQSKAARRRARRLEFESLESRVVMSATGLVPEQLAAVQSASAQTTLTVQAASIAATTAELLTVEQWVHSLAESQFNQLLPEHVQYLTTDQVRSMQRPEYFKLWLPESRAALSLTQVRLLNIGALGIGQLTSAQIGGLTATQVQQVKFNELQLLQPSQIPSLTNDQVGSIPHRGYLAAWSPAARAALTSSQVQRLNIATIGIGLLTSQQIAWLTVPQIQAAWFSEFHLLQPFQIPSLTNGQVASIPHRGYLEAWSPLARAALTSSQVPNLNIASMGVGLLTSQQIAWLTVPQIQAVKFYEFHLLHASQIPSLTAAQVQSIEHLGYFQTWSAAARAALTPLQVKNLNVTTIGIGLLTSAQINSLSVAQMQAVGVHQFSLLFPWQIHYLTPLQVQSIKQMGYLQAWSAEARAALLPWQIRLLDIPSLGISLLTREQIYYLAPAQIQIVDFHQFSLLSPWQIDYLTAQQVQSVREMGSFQSWSAELRAALLPWQIKLLHVEDLGIRLLTSQQIAALTVSQIQAIPTLDIAWLNPSQIQFVTPEQVNAFPYLADLPEPLQRALTREQLLSLPLEKWAHYGHEPVPPAEYHPAEHIPIGSDGLPTSPHLTTEAARVFALVPQASATHVTIASGNWSDPRVWRNGVVPAAGAKVLIAAGTTVQFDAIMNSAINTLRIDGVLNFATNRNTQLKADTIIVFTTGKLFVGTAANPIQDHVTATILIADNGPINTAWDPYQFSRGLISRGEVRMHGKTVTPYVPLAVDPRAGDTQLYLSQTPVNWRVGDRLVITGTDARAMNAGAEERMILAINGSVVTIQALGMNHDAPDGTGASLHVANLSRNIVLAAEDDSVIAERPHMMFIHNPNVELHNIGVYGFGRTDKSVRINDGQVVNGVLQAGTGTNNRARYAIHLHHTSVNPIFDPVRVTGSVVDGSPGWGFVNHSSNVDFEDNVAYQVFGAAFVSEDGNEIGSMRRNLAISTLGAFADIESRAAIHDFGFTGHGFWLQGPGVELVGNIAAGSRGAAYVIYMSSTKNLFDAINLEDPALAGGQIAVPVGSVPFKRFERNVAYAAHTGVDVWRHMQVMTDGMGVIDSFFSWNTWSVAVDLHYSGRVLIRNSYLIGDLQQYSGIAINPNFLSGDVYVENLYALGFDVGIHTAVRRSTIINGGYVAAVRGVLVEKGHADDRSVDINYLRFATLTSAQLQGRTQYDIFMSAPYDFRPFPAREVASLFSEDRILYRPFGIGSAIRMYYAEQLPSYVPFPSATATGYVPALHLNKTNQQLLDLYGVVYRGGLVPTNAILFPRTNGWAAI